jgi:hypothetical protein
MSPLRKPKIKKICIICDGEFEVWPSISDKRICCSRKCNSVWRRSHQKDVWKDPAYKQNFIDKVTGQTRTIESKGRMCEIQKRKWDNPDLRKKASETQKIITNNPERLKRSSENTKNLWKDPDYRKQHEEFMRGPNNPWRGKKRAEESNEKTRLSLKKTNALPEVREKRRAHMIEMMSDPVFRERMTTINIGKTHAEKTKLKLVESRVGGFWYGNVRYDEPKYCELWTDEFRERVRIFFSYQCVECGTPQNGVRFGVHHVHYDKKTCCKKGEMVGDRKFVPLCRSCHAKTNTNRPYWERHFTALIDDYYGGKCYFSQEEMEQFTLKQKET